MKKNLKICLLLLLLPLFSFSQWSQKGNNITGMEGDKLGSLHAIAMDANGTTVAVGTPFNSDNGAFSGYVEVYELDASDAWVLKGERMAGVLPDTEGTGSSVSLSADGNTLAVGIPYGINAFGCRCGIASVYDWDGTTWVMRGVPMEGGEEMDQSTNIFGIAISISADGNFIIVGGSGNTPGPNLETSGHARVYEWDGNQWAQRGADIDGLIKLERFGGAVSINDGGDVVVIGGRDRSFLNPDSSVISNVGYVRVVAWDGTAWQDRGEPFFGTVLGENLGTDVSISADGNTVAMGGPKNGPDQSGTARIFDWNGTSWDQRGTDITGDDTAKTGFSLDLSADGNVIAVGEPWANSVYGQVRVFRWTNNTWEQVDGPIAEAGAPNTINSYGGSVVISADGSRVAIGASSFDLGSSGFSDNGLVNIFENQTLVSVTNLEITDLSFFPNPTSDRLSINAAEKMERIEIYTITGQRVKDQNVFDFTTELDLSGLPAGAYFVKVWVGEKMETVRVVKM